MGPIQFTTEVHEVEGAYPNNMLIQLSGTGFSLRDRNDRMKDHRDLVDHVFAGLESEMLNSRHCHDRFAECSKQSEASSVVTHRLKRYLFKNHNGHGLHRESFNGIRDKALTSLWDTWKNDEAERS
jgi:hypothetical protein